MFGYKDTVLGPILRNSHLIILGMAIAFLVKVNFSEMTIFHPSDKLEGLLRHPRYRNDFNLNRSISIST